MQLIVKTEQMQAMVTKAVKGAGNNKLIPITSLMKIEAKDGQLILETTNGTNYVYVKQPVEIKSDFYAVVPVEIFSKLIARITRPQVTLEVENSILTVYGNGEYSIALPLNEEGEAIVYPDPVAKVQMSEPTAKVPTATFKRILTTVKPSLAVTLEVPCHTGYYCGDKVIATDGYKACAMDDNIFGVAKLINPEAMTLFNIIEESSVNVYIADKVLVFSTEDCIIYTREMDGIEDYPVEAIEGLLNLDFASVCELDTANVLAALDRLALFVSPYDKNAIQLEFRDEELNISNNELNSEESISYTAPIELSAPVRVRIDVTIFTEQVKANSSNTFKLHFGRNNAIKLTSEGNITQILALMS